MKGDPGFYRFFSFLPLFVFSMVMLVLADNFLVLFAFWEAVGLCSYLLIGYYFRRKSAADAAKKAFIVNRIGDFGFGIGIMLIFVHLHTLSFFAGRVSSMSASCRADTVDLDRGAALRAARSGKSAQFPLFVWLPDAMEGPTPVSALIHAATMVTAGVYMIARCYPIFSISQDALLVVPIVGAITAIHRGDDRPDAVRHQARRGLLDRLAARLHGVRARLRRVDRRDLPPGDARGVQGAALPRLRLGHPRHARRAGHAPHGRPEEVYADHLLDLPDRRGWPTPGSSRWPGSGARTRSCVGAWIGGSRGSR